MNSIVRNAVNDGTTLKDIIGAAAYMNKDKSDKNIQK